MFRTEEAARYFREHEGVIDHMYLDVVGLVTIGVGFLLPSPESACQLKLVNGATGATATDAEKAQDWKNIFAQEKGKLALSYRRFTRLSLPQAEIDAGLLNRLEEFRRLLRGRLPDLDSFPEKAQIGLLDMIYSLGPKGLFVGYPAFCAAAAKSDWRACARESKRRNVSESRNQDLAQLFREAAREG